LLQGENRSEIASETPASRAQNACAAAVGISRQVSKENNENENEDEADEKMIKWAKANGQNTQRKTKQTNKTK